MILHNWRIKRIEFRRRKHRRDGTEKFALAECGCGSSPRWIRLQEIRRGRSTGCPRCAKKRTINVNAELGKVYGDWIILRFAGWRKHERVYACQCSCGLVKDVLWTNLRKGESRRCLRCAARLRATHA